jgi:SpoVK/Ycf46/Vps4 family AAA+-type ATPase
MSQMPAADTTDADLPSQFTALLAECRQLYKTSGELAARQQVQLLDRPADQFIKLMEDLHGALALKVFVTVCEADRGWHKNEVTLAEAMIRHLWNRTLEVDELREAISQMSQKAAALKWYSLVRPFDQIAPLRNRVGELEAIVVRMAHLVARADGPMKEVESARIKGIQEELARHLRPIPIDDPSQHAAAEEAAPAAIEKIYTSADNLPTKPPLTPPAAKSTPLAPESLAEVLEELDALIGLAEVKHEVRTLANFLKVQAKRTEAGLPATTLSLHMVFGGNPGTGKTTVARIVGRIFGAMGILKKGHLVETDRSGLVAQYAGQTAPKTQKKIDEALDGVLFIDEAYTLIHADGDDPYGHEAVQTLLKRMEDDRDRLVVILAGYPDEMAALLDSNPGLMSRFSRHLTFADYSPLELARIFGQMCAKSHYRLAAAVRAKLMLGLAWLYEHRDRRFGNGRTVRNLFEHAIRRQANRIAALTELSHEQLSTLEADDAELKDCPTEVLAEATDDKLRFHIVCPHCQHGKDVSSKYLGQSVRCPKCRGEFVAEWGETADAQNKKPRDKAAGS